MKLTKKQTKQLHALARMKDEDIDFSDIPEKLDWSNAAVGKFYRPIKKLLTIRIDADVLARIKSGGKGYQTRINRYLRVALDQMPNYPWEGAMSFEGGHWPSTNQIDVI